MHGQTAAILTRECHKTLKAALWHMNKALVVHSMCPLGTRHVYTHARTSILLWGWKTYGNPGAPGLMLSPRTRNPLASVTRRQPGLGYSRGYTRLNVTRRQDRGTEQEHTLVAKLPSVVVKRERIENQVSIPFSKRCFHYAGNPFQNGKATKGIMTCKAHFRKKRKPAHVALRNVTLSLIDQSTNAAPQNGDDLSKSTTDNPSPGEALLE